MSLSLSSSSATVAVEKATSDLLMSPDWTMNIDICDSLNSHHWQAKDVVKAVKKRLQHRNWKVQLLALTLLETMVKNCGDYVHSHIAERNILGEMIKIVKKKADMQVRDKILVLLDSWQEAFGGSGGKYPQYYWAYDEIRRSGVQFPKRSGDAVPIITPPLSGTTVGLNQASYGMPSNSSRRLDETMATEIEGLSLSSMDSMRNIMELLNDMLQAVNPSDSAAVKDEIIIDLVDRCRANQKKLMQMLTTTGDEELLAQGLELNDSLQHLLAKHNAIASGSPMPNHVSKMSPQSPETSASSIKGAETKDSSLRDSGVRPNTNSSPPLTAVNRIPIDEEEEEEDEFAQLARRHSKVQPIPGQSSFGGITDNSPSITTNLSVPAASTIPCNALALPDPPAPVKTSAEQNMIDLLSITLSTSSVSPHTPHSPASDYQVPVPPITQGYNHPAPAPAPASAPAPAPAPAPALYNNYVVPWAQPHPQTQPLSQVRLLQPRPQSQPLYAGQYSSSPYPPPPWAASSVHSGNQNNISGQNVFLTPRANRSPSYASSAPPAKPLQHYNSFPSKEITGPTALGDSVGNSGPRNPTVTSTGQKPFVPSYRLFEDLNVFGNNTDGRFSSTASKLGRGGRGEYGQ